MKNIINLIAAIIIGLSVQPARAQFDGGRPGTIPAPGAAAAPVNYLIAGGNGALSNLTVTADLQNTNGNWEIPASGEATFDSLTQGGYEWQLNADGSGEIANGNIDFDHDGDLNIYSLGVDGNAAINWDGSGEVAQNNITWDGSGDLQVYGSFNWGNQSSYLNADGSINVNALSHFSADGSGGVADDNISWDSSGDMDFNGNAQINADGSGNVSCNSIQWDSSGDIGGPNWNINDDGSGNLAADDIQWDGSGNFQATSLASQGNGNWAINADGSFTLGAGNFNYDGAGHFTFGANYDTYFEATDNKLHFVADGDDIDFTTDSSLNFSAGNDSDFNANGNQFRIAATGWSVGHTVINGTSIGVASFTALVSQGDISAFTPNGTQVYLHFANPLSGNSTITATTTP